MGLTLVGATGIWFFAARAHFLSDERDRPESVTLRSAPQSELISDQLPIASVSSPLPIEIPDRDTYAREAIADPHAIPASLGRFARKMSERMEVALASGPAAVSFFSELSGCALREGGLESVRAVCAVNAARLAEKFPVPLARGMADLKERLPRDVLQSLDLSGESSGFKE